MSVSAYVRRILARWRTIAVVTAVLMLGALVLTLTADPVYSSRAQLYVASAGDESDLEAIIADGVQVKGRALSYAAVAETEAMALAVIDDLDLDDSPDSIAHRINAEVPFATVLINLTVSGDSPEEAQAVAGAVVDSYNDVLADVEAADADFLQVQVATLEEPSFPVTPTSPRPLLNLTAALVAGLMLGVALAVLRDLTDDSVRDANDLRGLGLMPLAVVPTAASPTDPGFARAAVGLDAVLSGLAGRTIVLAPCTTRDIDPSVGVGLTAAVVHGDVTLLECGPTRELADARSAARQADGAVLIATAGSTSRTDLREATLELTDVGARVLGVVLRDERRG